MQAASGADPIRLSCQEQLEKAGLWREPPNGNAPSFVSTRVEVSLRQIAADLARPDHSCHPFHV